MQTVDEDLKKADVANDKAASSKAHGDPGTNDKAASSKAHGDPGAGKSGLKQKKSLKPEAVKKTYIKTKPTKEPLKSKLEGGNVVKTDAESAAPEEDDILQGGFLNLLLLDLFWGGICVCLVVDAWMILGPIFGMDMCIHVLL